MTSKRERFAVDTFFREGLKEWQDAMGEAWEEVLFRSAIMVVKPDGIATDNLGVIRKFLAAHHLTVIGAEEFQFNRHMGRELWRYQHTLATPDRLAVEDIVLQSGPSLLLLLRAEETPYPATVKVSSLKGKAGTSREHEDTLRSLLKRPNQLFSMVHSADEPADLVRELSILIEPQHRGRLHDRFLQGDSSTLAERLMDEIEESARAAGPPLIDRERAIERLRRLAQDSIVTNPRRESEAARLISCLDSLDNGRELQWRAFMREIVALELEVDVWDLAILGSSHVTSDEVGASKLIGKSSPDTWLGVARTASK